MCHLAVLQVRCPTPSRCRSPRQGVGMAVFLPCFLPFSSFQRCLQSLAPGSSSLLKACKAASLCLPSTGRVRGGADILHLSCPLSQLRTELYPQDVSLLHLHTWACPVFPTDLTENLARADTSSKLVPSFIQKG